MKIRCFALALSLLALAVPALAGSDDETKPGAPPAGGPSAAEMEAWQKSMTPGPEHQQLAKFAGDWTFTNKAWMAPGQPPMESTGTMHGEATMGGRYLVEDWKGAMMGQDFEGRGTTAYNNVSKQYETTWLDNMSTGIWYSTGTCDAANVCTFSGDSWDPMSGKKVNMRSVLSWVDADTFKMVMYGPGPDGKEFQMMEIVAKRKS
jgi:hypothetical protein